MVGGEMNFPNWTTIYHAARAAGSLDADRMNSSKWHRERASWLPSPHLFRRASLEGEWVAEHRPFYNVYPVVAEPLLKVNLDVECQWITFPVQPILIRFSVPLATGGHSLSAMIASVSEKRRLRVITQTPDVVDAGKPGCAFIEVDLIEGQSVEQVFTATGRTPNVNARDEAMFTAALRVACGVALLARDSDIIEPEVLADDRGKPLTDRLVDKAKRRGVRGWSIGKHIEHGPHLRKPHFAIRWMGKGRVDPRLRPIKGSVVNKKAIAQVPTGMLDDVEAREAALKEDDASRFTELPTAEDGSRHRQDMTRVDRRRRGSGRERT